MKANSAILFHVGSVGIIAAIYGVWIVVTMVRGAETPVAEMTITGVVIGFLYAVHLYRFGPRGFFRKPQRPNDVRPKR